jgi:predicted peroxiredoxin
VREAPGIKSVGAEEKDTRNLYVVLCASGFDNVQRLRSALMFASLAASANLRTVLYCIQDAVEAMVKGAPEKREAVKPGVPTVAQRLDEARLLGVTIQCCSQTMSNKRIRPEDLVEGVEVAGAMSLIELTTRAKGSVSF